MRVALIGASGMIGSRVLKELLSRGHRVVAIVRDPSKVAQEDGVTAVQGDLSAPGDFAEKLQGVDAVVSAYNPPQGKEPQVVEATRALLESARKAVCSGY